MKVTVIGPFEALAAGHNPLEERSECEHICWEPKDGELCLNRVKPWEILVEFCSESDVQFESLTFGIVTKDQLHHLVSTLYDGTIKKIFFLFIQHIFMKLE